ncbi:MAG: MFS transporter [Chitinispirillaceae bacterium]|nr:MFS transporter [Chitinispirillaceae bacterium]
MKIHTEKLFNKDFVLIWQGQLVSQIGTQAFMIGIILYIKETTSSVFFVSLLILISRVPTLIFGPIGGVLADRCSRRNIMIYCDLISGFSILFLAFITIIMPPKSYYVAVSIFIVSLVLAIAESFFRPAISSALPDIVPHNRLSIANTFNQGTIQVARIFGQGTSGILYRQIGAQLLFVLNGVSYLFSAITELFITIPYYQLNNKKASGQTLPVILLFKNDITAGFHYVWKRSGLRSYFLSIMISSFFVMPFVALLPFYLEDVVQCGSEWYGYLMGTFGIGTIFGFLLINTSFIPSKIKAILLVIFVIITPAGLLLIAIFPLLELVITSFLLLGIMQGFLMIKILTTIQLSTNSTMRGRVMGLFESATHGLSTVAMVLAGIAADLTDKNILAVMKFFGITGTFLLLVIFSNNHFRKSFITLSDS